MSDKYPWPWTMTGIGPGEWVINDANGAQLLNISADHSTVDDAYSEEDAKDVNKYGERGWINVFTAETQETELVDRPGDIFGNLDKYGINDEAVPLLCQLERLLKGPK